MAIQIKNPITVMGAENLDTVLTEQDTALNNLETEINNLSPNTPSNALVKPTTAPTSQSIVSIDTNNEQQNLTLGDGLSISNNVLSASGGGSDYIKEIYTDKTVAEMQAIITAKRPDIIDFKTLNSSTRIGIPITIYTQNSEEWTTTSSELPFADETSTTRLLKTGYDNDRVEYISHHTFNYDIEVFSSQITVGFNGSSRVEPSLGGFSAYDLTVTNPTSLNLSSSAIYNWTIYYKNEN